MNDKATRKVKKTEPGARRFRDSMIFDAAVYVLKKNFVLFAVLLIAIAAAMALQVIPAFIIRRIIDENFSAGILDGVWRLAAWYLLVSAGSNTIEFIKVGITTFLGQHMLVRLRIQMSKRLAKLPMRYFTKTPVGETMSRITTDVDAIGTLFSSGIVGILADLVNIGGLMVSLYIIVPEYIWLEAAAIPLIFLFSNYFRKHLFRLQKTVREKVAELYTFIQEWLRGIKTVKAYSLEETGEVKFRKPLKSYLSASNANSLYDSWFPCIMQVFRAVIIAVALWFGAKNGTRFTLMLSAGTLAAVVDLIGRIFAPIDALAKEIQTIQQAMAGISRVLEFEKEPLEIRPQEDQQPNEGLGLQIDDVCFSYGNTGTLRGINVTLKPGEKTVFIGRSGAGKTTLMNIVAGLYNPDSGTVRVCGVDPFTLPPQKRRRLIGIVPQMPQIFDGTVRENISLGDDTITDREISSAIALVGLEDVIARLPQGYDTVIGEGAAGLSSGEIQLLSLARAIAADPKVLLLDEPTSGMDAQTERRVFAAIRQAGQGRTIFSISHRLSGTIDADRVYLMTNGTIAESGTVEELMERGGWYAMYQRMEAAGWRD